MTWPPVVHQDVKDEIDILRANRIATFGGDATGLVDNTSALTAAAGHTVFFPAGTYLLSNSSFIGLTAGTQWYAIPGTVTFNFQGTTAQVFRTTGSDVSMDGINFTRTANNSTILFDIRGFERFKLSNFVINGQRDSFANSCNIFNVGDADFNTIRVTDGKITKCTYSLLMDNSDTATVSDIIFDGVTFISNYQTGLELNSPNGNITDVTVRHCIFKDNQKTTTGGGFAVGFAHVTRGHVHDCYVANHPNEAFHIEDLSQEITIEDNTMVACSTSQGGYVKVISNSRDIKIINNTMDGRTNTNGTSVFAVDVEQGGVGTTPGGRSPVPPTQVSVTNNLILGSTAAANAVRGVYLEATSDCTVANNRIIGSGTVTAGVYGGTTDHAIQVYENRGTTVTGNTINGWLYGFPPFTSASVQAFGHGTVVANNTIRNCSIGISALNTGAAVFTGNMFYNCVKPMLAGPGSSLGPFQAVITNNHAFGCAERMAITTTSRVTIPNGATTVTTGTGKTVTVKNLDHYLPSGTVITFSGTGVLTLTAAANTQATTLTGDVTVASITQNETANVTINYSPVGAQNHRLLGNNAEDVSGGLGYTQDIDGF